MINGIEDQVAAVNNGLILFGRNYNVLPNVSAWKNKLLVALIIFTVAV